VIEVACTPKMGIAIF